MVTPRLPPIKERTSCPRNFQVSDSRMPSATKLLSARRNISILIGPQEEVPCIRKPQLLSPVDWPRFLLQKVVVHEQPTYAIHLLAAGAKGPQHAKVPGCHLADMRSSLTTKRFRQKVACGGCHPVILLVAHGNPRSVLVFLTTRGATSVWRILLFCYRVAAGENPRFRRAFLNQSRLVRGSSASRRPSPIKLMASTVTKIATPARRSGACGTLGRRTRCEPAGRHSGAFALRTQGRRSILIPFQRIKGRRTPSRHPILLLISGQ